MRVAAEPSSGNSWLEKRREGQSEFLDDLTAR
jgi:hypothetical protein